MCPLSNRYSPTVNLTAGKKGESAPCIDSLKPFHFKSGKTEYVTSDRVSGNALTRTSRFSVER